MEICVNDYIRTDKGYIRKIDKIDECKYCGQNVYIYKETIGDLHFEHTYHKGDLTKHSKNIIDLIQCGDYVNGHLVFDKAPNCVYIEDNQNKLAHIPYTKEKIKSVVTKEQYEQNSYKL